MNNSIRILVTGDLCPINRIEQLVLKEKYEEIYNQFYPYLMNNEINITNLECPLIDKHNPIDKIGPTHRSSEKSIELLKHGNFNLVTLSNNHVMDHGVAGLLSTVHLCLKHNIEWVGAGKNLSEASSIWYKEINNLKIAILNFSEEEFSSATELTAGSNPLEPIRNHYEIKEARGRADYVIIIVHGGHEGYQLPSPRMVDTYRFFVDSGADIVIGHHSHCFSGYEMYKKKMIFYSLGNFIFDDKSKMNTLWNFGYALKIDLNQLRISFKIIPYKQCIDIPGIFLLDEKEAIRFGNELNNLNRIIHSRNFLLEKWEEFIKIKMNQYKQKFECFDSKVYRSLRHRKIIPSHLSKRKKLILLNMLRCPSHRDLSVESLK